MAETRHAARGGARPAVPSGRAQILPLPTFLYPKMFSGFDGVGLCLHLLGLIGREFAKYVLETVVAKLRGLVDLGEVVSALGAYLSAGIRLIDAVERAQAALLLIGTTLAVSGFACPHLKAAIDRTSG